MGRLEKIDLEFDGQDLMIFRRQGKRGIPGRMIRHGRHKAGVDKSVLLAVSVVDFKL